MSINIRSKIDIGMSELLKDIKKRPNLSCSERKSEITKFLLTAKSDKEIKSIKFKTALYLTELERGDKEIMEVSDYIETHYLAKDLNTTSNDTLIQDINVFQEKLNKINNSITNLTTKKVEEANKQLKRDINKEVRKVMNENFILMYDINIRLINLKLMYEYIITKMISVENTRNMTLGAKEKKWNQFRWN
jgi:hypothetical protein